jgi:hypothetical protein
MQFGPEKVENDTFLNIFGDIMFGRDDRKKVKQHEKEFVLAISNHSFHT